MRRLVPWLIACVSVAALFKGLVYLLWRSAQSAAAQGAPAADMVPRMASALVLEVLFWIVLVVGVVGSILILRR